MRGFARLGRLQICRVKRHGIPQVRRFAYKHQPGVIGNVEPLVTVGGDGVGLGQSPCELSSRGSGGGPQAECAVDVYPSACLVSALADGGGRIESAAIHIPSLDTNDGAIVERRQFFRAHSTLVVGGNGGDTGFSEAHHGQSFQEGNVHFFADNHLDLRRAKQATVFHVPSRAGQQGMASGGESGEIGHGGARYESAAGLSGQAKQVAQPVEGDVLESGGGGRHHAERAILVPGYGEPGGGQGRRQRASNDKTEVATSSGRDCRRRPVLVEQLQHIRRIRRFVGER